MAFASECLDRMRKGPARTHVESLINEHLGAGAVRVLRGQRDTRMQALDEFGGSRMTSAAKRLRGGNRCFAWRARRAERSTCRKCAPISRSCGEKIRGKPLVYLDNAATSQKPQAVIDAIQRYYEHENANIHRGVHFLSEQRHRGLRSGAANGATFPECRANRKRLSLFAAPPKRSTWWRRPTAARTCGAGDEVLITGDGASLEHRARGRCCARKRARGCASPRSNDRGELLLDEFAKLLGPQTKLVAAAHVSNALGTINPVRQIIELAHRRDIPVLVDGAQAVPHLQVDVQALDCDFYAFSGHKIYGPTGIGVLYGKAALLDAMPPYQGGGDMISSVTFEKTIYNKLPYKFEAGTPRHRRRHRLWARPSNIVNGVGIERVAAHEHELLEYATGAGFGDSRRSARRNGERKGRSALVCDGGRPPARHRNDPRPRGHRDSHRPSLRAAGDAALRYPGHGARLFRLLQHARRGRRAGRGHRESARGVRLMSDLAICTRM